MRITFSGKITGLSVILLTLSGCAAATPESQVARACSETIGLSAQLSELQVGEQRVKFLVFPQQAASDELPQGPDPLFRVRFFRVITESPELTRSGQELRLYAPETLPVAGATPTPVPTLPSPSQTAHGYEASVSFDKPGAWGAEVFVRTAWQIAPAMATLMFQVRPSPNRPASAEGSQRDRVVYFRRCGGGLRLEPNG